MNETMEHLTEGQLDALVAGETDRRAQDHVDACATCAREVATLREAVTALRGSLMSEAARRGTTAWRRPSHARLVPTLLAAAAVAALALAGTLVLHAPSVVPSPLPVVSDPDDLLMHSVQQALARDVPEALAPAGLIAHDLAVAQAAGRMQ